MEKRTNIDILYQIAINRLDAQIKSIDSIDTKIGITFGLTNGITAALVAFVTFLPRPVSQLVLISVTLTAFAYLVTIVLLFFAYRYSGWSFRPDVKKLREIYTDPRFHEYPDIVKEWVADECIRSLEINSQSLINKVKLSNHALRALSAQGLLLAISCIFYLFN